MARSGGKRQAKSQRTASPPKASTAASSNAVSSAPPTPFTPAPSPLQPFLSTLPHDHVYLTHIDRTASPLKRRVFLVPCLLNLVIVLGLCVRIYLAFPTYIQQIIAIFGYESPYKVNTSKESATSLLGTVFERTFLIFFDYTLFALLGSWPREFLFGSKASRFAGPVEWRWTIRFRNEEVIVRRGRKWDTPLLESREEGKERVWEEDELITLKYKVGPAMTPSYLSKTGYLLLDRDFDLDFRGMLDAHRLAASQQSRLKLDDIDGCIFVYYSGQWLMWRPNANLQKVDEDPKVERFRQKLTELKCQDVFYRWIELVQFETNQPGGSTKAKQKRAMEDIQRLLEEKGLNFEKVLHELGGIENVPGLENL